MSRLRSSFSDNDKISLNGVVDRVDVLNKDGKTYVRVVDYKSSKKTIKADDIEDGNNLQMLIYLFALINGAKPELLEKMGAEGELLGAGVLYFGNFSRQVKHPGGVDDIEEALALAESNLSRSGILIDDLSVLKAMEKELEGKYIPYRFSNDIDTMRERGVLVSLERLKELYDIVQGTIREKAEMLKSGDATAIPSESNGYCTWCRMKTICRGGSN